MRRRGTGNGLASARVPEVRCAPPGALTADRPYAAAKTLQTMSNS